MKLLRTIIATPIGLTILFLILKLNETISWSWWWVLSPIWIPIGILIVVVVVLFILFSIYYKDFEDIEDYNGWY